MNLQDLKKEIPFKWRVQSSNKYGANCVAYIDSRQVQDLLDEVVGAGNWQCKFEEHKNNMFCSIGISIDKYETIKDVKNVIWKSDCGTESQVEKQKGEASDAFKRAAVMWGIGRFLYSQKIVSLPVKEKNGKFFPYSAKTGKFVYGDDISKWCNLLNK
tara:strand:- start:459 stop:932 length:474 start_codon:yes stop_codon:yes gene_type:complete